MHKLRGFRIRHKLVKLVKWKRNNSDSNYVRLDLDLDRPNYTSKAMSKLCGFARSLRRTAKEICCRKGGSSYIRLGDHRKEVEKNVVPKGHLAVYVGEKEDDARYLNFITCKLRLRLTPPPRVVVTVSVHDGVGGLLCDWWCQVRSCLGGPLVIR
nr:auxin-responsive protein SAUR36-like [Tanacetum cinerariifolium]